MWLAQRVPSHSLSQEFAKEKHDGLEVCQFAVSMSERLFRVSAQSQLVARKWALVFFGLAFIWTFFRYAWITEDAFINFRVIENVRDGYGLVWNPGERVQVFTSPMWMLLTLSASLLTGEELYTVIVLSFILVAATFFLLYISSGKNAVLFLAVATLFFSRSIRDYASSGLETPLLMLVVGAFVVLLCCGKEDKQGVFLIFLAASACLLVRHDALVLVLPFLLQQCIHFCRPWSLSRFAILARLAFMGAAPFLMWSLFSLIYYGSFFPNTAGAKIVEGFNQVKQASNYFQYMQNFDPAAYIFITLTIIVAFVFRDKHRFSLAAGVMLWVAYMVMVGGDYMAGRFFVGPVALSAFVLCDMGRKYIIEDPFFIINDTVRERIVVMLLFFLVVTFGFINLTARNASQILTPVIVDGVVDERSYYYSWTDLESLLFGNQYHSFRLGAGVVDKIDAGDSGLLVSCNIGMLGYYMEKKFHIIDPYALADPFLVGFPIRRQNQRIGHFERSVPYDYVLSLLNSKNEFTHHIAREYYDDVVLISRGDLFSYDRLKAVVRINTGYYSRKLDKIDINEMGGEMRVSQPNTELNSCLGGKSRPMIVVREERGQGVRLVIL